MAEFKANYAGIGELLRSAEMQAAMLAKAEQVKAAAEADAPYDDKDRNGDHYRDHFSARAGVEDRAGGRAVGIVENDSPIAFHVEYGTVHNDAHHTMTRALDAARD